MFSCETTLFSATSSALLWLGALFWVLMQSRGITKERLGFSWNTILLFVFDFVSIFVLFLKHCLKVLIKYLQRKINDLFHLQVGLPCYNRLHEIPDDDPVVRRKRRLNKLRQYSNELIENRNKPNQQLVRFELIFHSTLKNKIFTMKMVVVSDVLCSG